MQKSKYFFSHARTALKYGLKHLDLNSGDVILLPEYICDVVTHPIFQNGLNKKFYSIDENFSPIWEEMENLIDDRTKCILMVHYFGQPQNIELFISFCNKHNLYLIEDNAHGYGGTYNGQLLGTFGDIGISSPRKILNMYSGGILWLEDNNLNSNLNLIKYPISLTERLKRQSNFLPSVLKKFIVKKIKNRPIYENPEAFHEKEIQDYFIDDSSLNYLEKENMDKVRNYQQAGYFKFQKFAINNNLKPVINDLHIESCPWFFPAYTNNIEETTYWFKWGWENNLNIFSWPSLPKEIISKNGESLRRWEKLICFDIK